MISHIEGKIIDKDLKSIIVDISGIGYKILCISPTIMKYEVNDKVSFWTHFVVREDSMSLYGFEEKEERNFFELLITISGIGPKTALGILNASPVPSLKEAISSGETNHLTKVSGISKKIADKLVLELKDKVGDISENNLKDEVDAIEALKALGYSHKDAREALQKIGDKTSNTNSKIKMALKILGK